MKIEYSHFGNSKVRFLVSDGVLYINLDYFSP